MVVAALSLREDYWDSFEIDESDVEALYHHLLEVETPLSADELALVMVRERLRREKQDLEKRRSADGDIFLPKENYKVGQRIVVPALDWRQGEVINVRPGVNPDIATFEVIQVDFGADEVREFAAGLEDHFLNNPPEIDEEDSLLNPNAVLSDHGDILVTRLVEELETNPDFVYIAGRWFPKALLVDVNVGHLNLAEAVLDMEGGGPLPTKELLDQVELPTDVNPNLVEFSLDLALQEDPRFDEVGPAGKVLWYLKRLEPEEVLNPPLALQYSPLDYDRSLLDEEMLKLESDLDDELSPSTAPPSDEEEMELVLIYPHWQSGTIPLTGRMGRIFPTAYEAPRIRINLIEEDSGNEFSGWVVREEKYVYGLKEWFEDRGVMPGSILNIRRGSKPGEVAVRADIHRSTREWVRTVLVGADGGLVLAMLKQVVSTNFDDRMAIAVPDPASLGEVSKRLREKKTPFERIVVDIFKEIAKLNPQSHVHASELYAGVNLILRCPPGPILALLASRPWFVHKGDFYYRLTDFEG